MVKVFAIAEGAQIQIGHYGVATREHPACVPDEVASELAGRQDLRCERDDPAPRSGPPKKG